MRESSFTGCRAAWGLLLLALVACAQPKQRLWSDTDSSRDFVFVTLPHRGDGVVRVSIPADWNKRQREPSSTLGEWQLVDPSMVGLKRSSLAAAREVGYGPRPVAAVGDTGYARREAHRLRAQGKRVYWVRTSPSPQGTEVDVLGGQGWPLEWTRLVRFRWEDWSPGEGR